MRRLLIFIFLVSCVQDPKPHILSTIPHVKRMEEKDDRACVAALPGISKSYRTKTRTYWNCRLELAKQKILPTNSLPQDLADNLEIGDLITKISVQLYATPEATLIVEDKRLDERDHKNCIEAGYKAKTSNLEDIDEYLICRQTLLDNRQYLPPYGRADYLKYQNYSYNLGFVIDQRIDENARVKEENKEKYPACMKFNSNTEDFKKCAAAQDESKICYGKIPVQKIQKEVDEKVKCQRMVYRRFPDEFLKDSDERAREIKALSANADYYNGLTFASIGIIDPTKFGGQKDDKKSKESTVDKINSKKGLYTKIELARLRKAYIFSCQKEADQLLVSYIEGLEKGCEAKLSYQEVE